MTDTLYLRLERAEASAVIEARLAGRDGALSSGPLHGTLAELRAAHPEARIVALIPSGDALAARVRLPKISLTKLRHSLPFALEEQLASDLEGQHFAIGVPQETRGVDGNAVLDVPVVIIARARLASWLEVLRAAQAEPAAIHLAEDCIAAKPGDVVASLLSATEIFLRAPNGEGAATGLDELPVVLDLLLGDLPRQTLGLQVHASAPLRSALAADQLDKITRGGAALARMGWLAPHEDTLGWLVSQLPLAEPINLLQGEFAPKRRVGDVAARWRLAGALATTMVLLHFLDLGLELRTTGRAERAIDAQLLQAAAGTVPDVRSADELARRLALGTSGAQGAALLQEVLLVLVAAGLSQDSLNSLTLQSQTVQLECLPGTRIEPIVAALRERGWSTRVTANSAGAPVLLISRSAGLQP